MQTCKEIKKDGFKKTTYNYFMRCSYERISQWQKENDFLMFSFYKMSWCGDNNTQNKNTLKS